MQLLSQIERDVETTKTNVTRPLNSMRENVRPHAGCRRKDAGTVVLRATGTPGRTVPLTQPTPTQACRIKHPGTCRNRPGQCFEIGVAHWTFTARCTFRNGDSSVVTS